MALFLLLAVLAATLTGLARVNQVPRCIIAPACFRRTGSASSSAHPIAAGPTMVEVASMVTTALRRTR
ncbi:hypothetical protein GCM10027187_25140 [Streptosporangium sandarakinum]